jgi:hypothetical protein
MKAVKRLLKAYNFTTIDEYYDYIIENQINGNFTQVKSLFIELPLINRKYFLLRLVSALEIDNVAQAAHYAVLKSCINLMR